MPSILVVGATFVDINTTAQIVEGKLSLSSQYNIGGKGYNIAKGLSLFDLETHLATAINSQGLGSLVVKEAKNLNIQITQDSLGYSHTPLASIITNLAKDGSSEQIFEKVDTSLFEKQVLQTLPEGLAEGLGMIIVSSNCNTGILEFLKEQKKLNPNLEIMLAISGSKAIAPVLPYLDIFSWLFANRKEAAELQAQLNYTGSMASFIQHLLRPKETGGLKQVVFTLDKDGIVAGQKSSGQIAQFPIYTGYTEPVLNTVGAGDAFVSAVISQYILTNDFEQALKAGLQVAAYHIRSPFSSLTALPPDLMMGNKQIPTS